MMIEIVKGFGVLAMAYLFTCVMISIFIHGTMEDRHTEFKEGMNTSFVFRTVVFFYAPISFLKKALVQ